MFEKQWYKKGTALLDEIRATDTSDGTLALWNLGQCGYLLKFNGKLICIDVMLNDLCDAEGNSSRVYAPPFAPSDLKIDYVMCTHDHADHLAPETVKGIAESFPETIFIVPAAARRTMEDLGIRRERVLYMKDGKTVALNVGRQNSANGFSALTLGGIDRPEPDIASVRAFSTAHPTHHTDSEGNDFSLAYELTLGSFRLLHLGDTYLSERLYRSLKELPPLDILFAPINGNDVFRYMTDCIGNMEAEEAARLSIDLGVDLTIPTHYDMFKGNRSDPLRFARTMLEEGPGRKWALPALGERILLRK